MSVDESADRERRTRIVNSSGFPLEKKLAHDVRTAFSDQRIRWSVMAEGHPWRGYEDGQGGFIDLILSNGYQRLIIECKRPKAQEWIFLVEKGGADRATTGVRCPWVWTGPGRNQSGVHDFSFVPDSPEADTCVIPDEKPLLEHYSRKLIDSTEDVAFGDIQLFPAASAPPPLERVYVPAIVTSADLILCIHDPAKTDDRGNLRDPEYKTVPMVRFTKMLLTTISSDCWSCPGGDTRVRTVLVINAKAFIGQLRLLEHETSVGSWQDMPWHNQR